MSEPADPDALRDAIGALPELERKVLGGLVALMIAHHDRVRDAEWIAESFTRLAVAAHGFAATSAPDEDVETVREFARQRMGAIVGYAMQVFVRTAEELARREAPFDYEDACTIAVGLLGADRPGD